jgi:hypothetical protein
MAAKGGRRSASRSRHASTRACTQLEQDSNSEKKKKKKKSTPVGVD